MGQIFVEGHFFKKMVIFCLTLKAHHSPIFHPRDATVAFLSLSWHGHPKKIMHYASYPLYPLE